MNYDIIKLILYNLLFVSLLYYDKRIGILIIIFQILYWITIQSSIKNKVVEGFDLYFRDIFYMPDFDLDKIGFGSVLPNRAQYNSDYRDSSTTYSFFQGGGQSNVKSNDISLYGETEKLLKELTDFIENKKENCFGTFTREKCSKKCGYGEQKVTYKINDKNMNDSKCEHEDGHTYYDECFLKPCDNDKPCKSNFDCRSNNCIDGTCSTLFDCDKGHLLGNCNTKDECLYLNEKYDKGKFKYKWNGVKCNQDDKYTYSGTYDTELTKKDITATGGIKFKKVSGIGKPETSNVTGNDNGNSNGNGNGNDDSNDDDNDNGNNGYDDNNDSNNDDNDNDGDTTSPTDDDNCNEDMYNEICSGANNVSIGNCLKCMSSHFQKCSNTDKNNFCSGPFIPPSEEPIEEPTEEPPSTEPPSTCYHCNDLINDMRKIGLLRGEGVCETIESMCNINGDTYCESYNDFCG
jgi:hypothetical protein